MKRTATVLLVLGAVFIGNLAAAFPAHAEGPDAIRNDPAFSAHALPPSDDDSSFDEPLGFTANFFGATYSDLFVNNNGNITFDHPFSSFTPFDLNSTATKIIAPFFADMDTRGPGSGVTTWGYGPGIVDGHTAFGVDWINVGYYEKRSDKLNSFQLILIERADTGPGDFDIEFNYDKVQWESGEASDGVDGLGGSSARAGFSNGSGTSYEIDGSAVNGAFLDSNSATGLINNSLGTTHLGRYVFEVRNGIVLPPGPPSVVIAGSSTKTVPEGGTVPLSASSTSDPLTYTWDLDNDGVFETNGSAPSFSAVGLDGPSSHPITVRGCNAGGACGESSASVDVTNVAPVANAGANVSTQAGVAVSLSGTWTDPAGALDAPYQWTWTVPGSDSSGSAAYGVPVNRSATFATPGTYTVTFSVTDKDGDAGSASKTVNVTSASPSNRPPVCIDARPSVSSIWPPNHKFVPITIQGVTDPDGDPVSIVITSIYQDEAIGKQKTSHDGDHDGSHSCGPAVRVSTSSAQAKEGKDKDDGDEDDEDGDSKYSPADAYGVGTSTAYVRAERSGKGDGRVYHIRYRVSDGHGGFCTGEVIVGVPHSKNGSAVDGGALFDSTVAVGKRKDHDDGDHHSSQVQQQQQQEQRKKKNTRKH